jgi:hypothetical protein
MYSYTDFTNMKSKEGKMFSGNVIWAGVNWLNKLIQINKMLDLILLNKQKLEITTIKLNNFYLIKMIFNKISMYFCKQNKLK